jgi:hypothetical protein
MNFEYDTDVYKLDMFWINEEISYNQLDFTNTVTDRMLSFCCASTFTYTTVPVSLHLGGTNTDAFVLSSNNFTVNIVANATTATTPTLEITVVNTQKTYAKLTATTNLAGLLYYELKLAPLTNSLSLLQLKYEIKQKNVTLEQQSDFLTKQIYINDRDHRINVMAIANGVNTIEFENLFPERTYAFCAYF